MKTKSPVWLLCLFALVLPASATATAEISPVVPLGDNTYSVTAKATNMFTRNTAKLKAAGIEAATQFCAKEGRQFKLVSVDDSKSLFVVGGMTETKITFKSLGAGDPELGAAPAETARTAPPAEAARPAAPATPTDALYAELSKLDEMRRKGLLTDEEFAAQKKKVLERSK